MTRKCNNNLIETLKLTKELKNLAHKGLYESNDDSSILLYGLIKDCCYKIESQIDKELIRYKLK